MAKLNISLVAFPKFHQIVPKPGTKFQWDENESVKMLEAGNIVAVNYSAAL